MPFSISKTVAVLFAAFLCSVMQTVALISSSSPASSPLMSDNPSPALAPLPSPRPGIKGGYWPSTLGFPISAVDTSYFTHIYYAFVSIDPNTFEIVVTPLDDQMLPVFATTLHCRYPAVKALLSIGGAASNGSVFAEMVSSSATRSVFIDSTIAMAYRYNLDGLDLDWEFPKNRMEMDNLGSLFREWRTALDRFFMDRYAWATGRTPLLLTAAVYYASSYTNNSYPGWAIRDYVDWVNAMCYDYRGPWDPSATGAPAALFDADGVYSTSYGIQSWLKSVVPPEKVVMGLPLYGRTWQLKDHGVHEIGSAAVGVGPGNGTLQYRHVADLNDENDATIVYDGITGSTYSYWKDHWIGYDDERSVREKIEYALRYRLGGYFFWALGYDKDWSISLEASAAWGI
ncbi:class V chitinase CHIT5a-like [Aristolochia californica]|uniref:class V chitinase CHIT5a-like n=1 Tax=Aristolochia californica TaxID=171875 RepID=UPI0035DD612D